MVSEGAFIHKHLDALTRIEDVAVVSIADGVAEHTQAAAESIGDIIPPCGVPRCASLSSPASIIPAFNHFLISSPRRSGTLLERP